MEKIMGRIRGFTVSDKTKKKQKIAATGRILSAETKKKISVAKKGFKHTDEAKKKIGNYRRGRSMSKKTKEKLRMINTGKKASEKTKEKMRGRTHSEETKRKLRLSISKRIKEIYPNFRFNYSKKGCKVIEKYGKEHGYNFQHAMNGGEKNVIGYALDGYDEVQNVIIEYNEPGHKNQIDKDKQRNRRIIEQLKPKKFIILWETKDGYREEIIHEMA